MSVTTIADGDQALMRQLEDQTAAPAKAPAKRPRKKPDEAMLVLANGEMGEAGRLGLSLISAGVTAVTFGVLEGLARKGKAKLWRDLSPNKRGMVLIAFVIVAGMIARHRRQGGHLKSAQALETAAIAAWTLALAAFVEGGVGGEAGKLGELYRHGVGDLGADELEVIDSQLDDDVRFAAEQLRRLAAEQHPEREEVGTDDEGEDVGAFAYDDDWSLDDDDDDIFY